MNSQLNERVQAHFSRFGGDIPTPLNSGILLSSRGFEPEVVSDEMNWVQIGNSFIRIAREAKKVNLVLEPNGVEMGLASVKFRFDRRGEVDRPISQVLGLEEDVEVDIKRSPVKVWIDGGIILEIPLKPEERRLVRIKEVIEEADSSQHGIKCLLGRKNDGRVLSINFQKTPHALVAGTTGSGKTNCLYGIILSMAFLHSRNELEIIIADQKGELATLEDLPHLAQPIATTNEEFDKLLDWLEEEAAGRKALGREYIRTNVPSLVVVIDEFQGFDSRERLAGILAQARTLGMYFVLATQNPHHKIISSAITANCDTRICFRTSNGSQSQTILEKTTGKDLQGNGDGLLRIGGEIIRFQGALVTADLDDQESDIFRLVTYLKEASNCQDPFSKGRKTE